jgi:hypothetical protein
MKRARQLTYTFQHPHSHVTGEEKVNTDTKGGDSNFYNKLRKPGLELETLGSDTMLNFINTHVWRIKGEEKVNMWNQTEEEKVNTWTQRGGGKQQFLQ